MENYIKSEILDIDISIIRKFNNLANEVNNKFGDVIYFTLGEPAFNTPAHVKEAAIKAVNENRTKYSATMGMPLLREKVSDYIKKNYNLNYDNDEIMITTGSTEAINVAMYSILNPGDEVIIPTPAYPLYETLAKLNKCTIKYVDTKDLNFQITSTKIKEAITDKTKLIIFSSPSNPTGVQVNDENKKEIVNILKENNIFMIVDEVYSEFVFNGNFSSFGTFSEIKDKLIIINGFSKSHSMTGWRLGYALSDKKIIKHLNKVHMYTTSSPNSISQYAAISALETKLNHNHMYKEKYDYVYDRLIKMGFDCIKPDGTFYIFPSIKKFELSSFDFCKQLLDEAHVACVPGNAFSNNGEGFIRLSYDLEIPILKEGLDRIELFVNQLKKSE